MGRVYGYNSDGVDTDYGYKEKTVGQASDSMTALT